MDKLVGSRSAVISRNAGPIWAAVQDDGFWTRCVSLAWASQSLEVDRRWWTEDGGTDECCSILFSSHFTIYL